MAKYRIKLISSGIKELLKSKEITSEVYKAAMQDIIGLNEICKCKLNSDYNFTDTSINQYRYQAVYDIVHY